MNNDLNPMEAFIAKREREQQALAASPPQPPLVPVALVPTYPGIGRLAYTIGQTILWAGGYILAAQHSNTIITCLLVLVGFLNIALVALRLENIGVSMWFTLTSMIPFVNIILVLSCLIAPPSYHYHRQMDTAGGAIVAALAALVTIVIALAVFG